MSTLDYYNNNANMFVADTKEVKFTSIQEEFVAYLKPGDKILDFGCGAGRDSAAFIGMGYDVEPIDGSIKLCQLTSAFLGKPVKQMLFQDLDETEEYDGIWACASILHLHNDELPGVLKKIYKALKVGGVFYTSFKYGDFQGYRNGRYYTDVDEDHWKQLISDVSNFATEKIWITGDARPGREDEKWFNVIMRKKDL